MKRTALVRKKPMARGTGFKKKPGKCVAGNSIKALKATGRRLVPKDEAPIYDDKHLALVRAQPCLVSGASGCVAHHARGMFLRTMGVRVTDFVAVPLLPTLHDGYGHSLHNHGSERSWWSYNGWPKERLFAWLRQFLLANYDRSHPGVVQAFAKMAAEEERC